MHRLAAWYGHQRASVDSSLRSIRCYSSAIDANAWAFASMFSEKTSTMPRYAYIDALRGYAILGVISVHTSGAVPHLGGRLRDLATSGQYGVHLFFVVSALTLVMSWHARSDGTYRFYIRRLFRIA